MAKSLQQSVQVPQERPGTTEVSAASLATSGTTIARMKLSGM
jgi:hypothetical protein